MSRLHKRFLDCKGMSIEEAESFGTGLAEQQRDCLFQLGDLARYAEAKWPATWQQVFPEWISPGLVSRTAAVAKAYPREEDRQAEAPYTIYMRETNRPDRIQRVAAHVQAGRNSDEAAKANQEERANDNRPRWLLAFDIHYFAHRHFFSGAGVETAHQVAEWVKRTVERLKLKGASDVLCAFEGHGSFRKELTVGEEWAEHRYKGNRGPKPDDLAHQLQLVRELLEGYGYCCLSHDGFEADDCLASAAAQFPGKVTILTQDKDLKQCLSNRVNMLLDVQWVEDETSGDMLPEYKWYTAGQLHDDTGLTPEQFPDLQAIQGDSVDCIQGAPSIGEKGALNLMREFGNVAACIAAAKQEDEKLLALPRGKAMISGLLELEKTLEVTRQLVTLRTELPLPTTTRV